MGCGNITPASTMRDANGVPIHTIESDLLHVDIKSSISEDKPCKGKSLKQRIFHNKKNLKIVVRQPKHKQNEAPKKILKVNQDYNLKSNFTKKTVKFNQSNQRFSLKAQKVDDFFQNLSKPTPKKEECNFSKSQKPLKSNKSKPGYLLSRGNHLKVSKEGQKINLPDINGNNRTHQKCSNQTLSFQGMNSIQQQKQQVSNCKQTKTKYGIDNSYTIEGQGSSINTPNDIKKYLKIIKSKANPQKKDFEKPLNCLSFQHRVQTEDLSNSQGSWSGLGKSRLQNSDIIETELAKFQKERLLKESKVMKKKRAEEQRQWEKELELSRLSNKGYKNKFNYSYLNNLSMA